MRNRWLERGKPVRRISHESPVGYRAPKYGRASAILATRHAQDVESLSRLVEELDLATFTRCAELIARPGVKIHVVGERRGYAVAAHAVR